VDAEKLEAAGLVGGAELGQERSPEQARENRHGQEKVRSARDPSLAVERDAAAWHDHVDMGMVRHRRAPSVQHRGDACLPVSAVLGSRFFCVIVVSLRFETTINWAATSSRPDANRLSSFTEFQRTPCALASSHGRYFLTLSPHERFPRREGRPIGLAVVTGFEILWAYPRSAARPYRNKQGGRWPSVSTDIPWSERSHLRILSLIRQ
jgi:hypothetical protein